VKTQTPSNKVPIGRLALIALCAVSSASSQVQTNDKSIAPAATPPVPLVVENKEEVVEMESFTVTGTLIKGTTTFTSPAPVLVIEQINLVASAPVNMADGLKQLPAVAPGGGQTVGGGTGNNSANFLNLRGLGTSRTLTLLDGRRYTPSGPTGEIDANLIPQGLVDHVDVVNGGASAAYGSDAVGGVINFVLNKEFTGFKADVLYGVAEAGDNQEYRAMATLGSDYLKGRGHFVFSGEYLVNKGVAGDARESRTSEPNQIPDPANLNMVVRANDIRTPFTTGGLVVIGTGGTAANNALLSGIMFGPGGVQRTYNYGTLASDVGKTAGFQNGGDGYRVGTSQEIVRPLTRKTLFARTDFKLRENISLFIEGSYGESQMDVQNSPTTHTLTIKRTNAYLAQYAPTLVAQMTSLGVTALTMNRLTLERGLTESHINDQNLRGLVGFSGKLNHWNWETSYQWGSNDLRIPVTNNLITANMAIAADAVLVGGQIVCAAAATNPSAVPFNPFGAGAPSKAALDYVMGTSQYDNYTTQSVADAHVSGEVFTLPAGPVSAAIGAQWRNMESTTTSDAASIAGAYRLANNQPFTGAYTIVEEFAEAQVPVLKDAFLVKRLNATLAARHTNYSTSGGANTWKAGVLWQITSDLRLRASRSRDIRAPNLNELFSAGVQTNGVINDNYPGGTGKTYSGVPNIAIGNLDLKPENSMSSVVGFVYQPSWFRDFSLAVDYYSTMITDAIYRTGGSIAVRECDLNPTSPLCAFVTRGPTIADPNAVIQTRTAPVNLNSQTSKGVDVEASYQVPLGSWFHSSNPGKLTLRALAGYVDENILISPLAPVANQAGNATPNSTSGVTALPRIRGTLTVNYSRGPATGFLQARYIGRMTWDKTRILGVTTDFNDVTAASYLDGQVGYKVRLFGRNVDIYLNVQNILNQGLVYDPRSNGATPMPTDPGLYDQIGRMFRIGVKTRF
jgi:outer membrane receptor protein involved in Fe transport